MISYISHVMTLANSIIGVSVLAMPFCFKQCGIILSVLVLTLCSLLSRIACHFLIKSAVMSRRRNYEFLAFHAFGPMGKILVELLIIGFLIGTCIAFFVVVGDLGPQIIGKLLNKNPEDIKLSFLLTTASLIILPLGLLKNIESLASICTVAIGFYLCLVLKVITESMGHIFMGDWYDHVNYWRPAGILQCLPIFSMALFCQTQLFEIYESIPNVSLEKMNVVVRGAINICTLVYISVGFFGYIAFCTQSFSGNILMSFEPSLSSDAIKIGFVLSVIASFPLVIFPCRASLNSLLFRRVHMHDAVTNYIPEIRFRCLTFAIITVSLITGLSMPNIEFVLGLVGSTIGVLICLIFPAAFFIAISTKNTNERLIAQAMLFVGMWIMILGTYASIYSVDESSTTKVAILTDKSILQINNIQLNQNIESREIIQEALAHPVKEKEKLPPPRANLQNNLNADRLIDPRGADNQMNKIMKNINLTLNLPEVNGIAQKPKVFDENVKIKVDNSVKSEIKNVLEPLSAEEKMKLIEENERKAEQQVNENLIHSDAIKKEDSEIAAAADQFVDAETIQRLKKQQIQETLEQNKIEAIELMKEQKAILQDIKEQKKEFEMDEKLLKNLKSNKEIDSVVKPIVEAAGGKKDERINNVVVEEPKKPMEVQAIKDKKVDEPLSLSGNELNVAENETQSNIVGTKQKMVDKTDVIENSVALDLKSSDAVKVVNVSTESRGPILNALTNKTAIQQADSNLPLIIGDADKTENQNDSNNLQYAIPIALRLINRTKDNIVQAVDPIESVNYSPVIHRDILEDHAREKREADDVMIRKNDIEDTNITEHDEGNQECTKNETIITNENSNDSKNIVDVESTTKIIIKTYASLSDEKFVDNINKFNPNSLGNINEYQIVKKRDLKSLKPGKSRN